MDRLKLKLLVDMGMAISFLVLALTGLFKWPSLMMNFSGVYGIIDFRLMSKIHDWSGVVLVLFILVHLCLNWTWIKSWFVKK